jgi:DNA polymerase-3 subunit beta
VKFRVERDVLAEAVTWTARSLPTRPSVPVLSGLKLEASDGTLTLSGFDYETSARVSVPAQVADEGSALVSGRLLAEIARALPAHPVDVSDEGGRVVLLCRSSRFTLQTLPLDEYPSLPDLPSATGRVRGDLFADAVAQVAIAAGRDDMLPVFTGLRLEIDGEKLTLAATDRFRLAVRELEWRPERPDASGTALIPARVLAEATRAFAGSPSEITLALSGSGEAGGEGLLGLTGEAAGGIRHTTTRLLDGEFPPYRKLFPPEQHTEAYVDTAAIIESLKRVALVAERHTSVQLNFAEGQVVLEAGSGDEAQASEALPARIEGDGVATGFNPRYLLDGLSAVRSAVTRLSFTLASRPAVITPADGEHPVAEAPDASDGGNGNASTTAPTSTNGDYRYLIMPVRVPR